MHVYFASDHAGYKLKQQLIPFVAGLGHTVSDIGPATYNKDDDYPDFVRPAAEAVAANAGSMGIIIGLSGQGEAMVANRVSGIRAAVYYGRPCWRLFGSKESIPKLSRLHNDANVLSLGAGFISTACAKKVVGEWLATPFSGEERHSRRIAKI